MAEKEPKTPDLTAPADSGHRAPSLPIHPARAVYRSMIASSGLLLTAAGLSTLTGDGTLSSVAFVFAAATTLGSALYGLRQTPGLQLVNAAANQASMGRYEIALQLLERAEREHKLGSVKRAALATRASIALDQGDPLAAMALCDRALAIQAGMLTRQIAGVHVLKALSIRAYCRAVTGDDIGAREDKARIDALTHEMPFRFFTPPTSVYSISGARALREILARSELSKAVLLAQSGDKKALRAHLEKHRTLLHEGTLPRERALVRGFSRMLSSKASSAYRRVESAAKSEEDSESAADWVERTLPEVAPFILPTQVVKTSDEATTALPASGAERPIRTDWSSAKRVALAVGAWSLMVIGIISAWYLSGSRHPDPTLVGMSIGLPLAFVVGLFALGVSRVLPSMRRRKAVVDHLFALARSPGNTAALQSLEALSKRSDPFIAGQAALALAQQKNMEGNFQEAAEIAARAIPSLERRLTRIVAFEALVPALESERALAHAALGQIDDAVRGVDSLTEDYAWRARSIFSVKLVALAHEGSLAEAAELIETSLVAAPIDRPIEVLADMIRATHSPHGLGLVDRQRLQADLADPSLRAWLEKATPLALEAFEAREDGGEEQRTNIRVESSLDESETAHQHPLVDEALREQEALEELIHEHATHKPQGMRTLKT